MEKYTVLSPEAMEKLCSLIRESHSVSEGINDNDIQTSSTFSSKYISELLSTLSEEDRGYTDEKVAEALTGGTVDLTSYYKKYETDALLEEYVKKEEGKGLSTNDFTATDKEKLDGLENYDDTEITGKVADIESDIEILNGDASTDGSVAKQVADSLTEANAYTDQKFSEIEIPEIDDSDLVSKTNDVVSTYTGDESDTTKIPNLASMKALEDKLQDSINDIINIGGVEIYDGLDSTSTIAALSANQGKVLDEKINTKFDIAQSEDNVGFVAAVGEDGNMTFVDPSTFVPNIEYPVTSVNGQTGDVEISTNSIGAVSNEEFSTTNAKVLSMETTVETLQTQVETNTDELADVLALAQANVEGVTALNGQVGTISELANTANTNAAEALTKAQNAENTVSIQQSTVTNLSNQVGDMVTTVEGHTASINTLQTSIGGKANASDVYTKDQVDSKVSSSVTSVYKYKGNVESLSALGSIESPENGHVYFVTEDSLNYAYTDGSWNPLAGIIDLSDYVTDSDMTTALASKANTTDIKTKTSQLENDSEFVTQTDVEAMLSSAGVGAVQTVNGKYGNVELNAADVGAVTADEVSTTVSTALENYYTKTEVDIILGDIESVLDEINGEII